MLSMIYNSECPCRGCMLRNEDCHSPNKCLKGDNLYQKWKANSERIPYVYKTTHAKAKMLAKARKGR